MQKVLFMRKEEAKRIQEGDIERLCSGIAENTMTFKDYPENVKDFKEKGRQLLKYLEEPIPEWAKEYEKLFQED